MGRDSGGDCEEPEEMVVDLGYGYKMRTVFSVGSAVFDPEGNRLTGWTIDMIHFAEKIAELDYKLKCDH